MRIDERSERKINPGFRGRIPGKVFDATGFVACGDQLSRRRAIQGETFKNGSTPLQIETKQHAAVSTAHIEGPKRAIHVFQVAAFGLRAYDGVGVF